MALPGGCTNSVPSIWSLSRNHPILTRHAFLVIVTSERLPTENHNVALGVLLCCVQSIGLSYLPLSPPGLLTPHTVHQASGSTFPKVLGLLTLSPLTLLARMCFSPKNSHNSTPPKGALCGLQPPLASCPCLMSVRVT